MFLNRSRNVCAALPETTELLLRHGRRQDSRAGPVIVLPAPLMTATMRPRERVLFSPIRDANPFFHLVESIWMLAGRDDAATLNCYVRDFGDRFAERQHGDPLPESGSDRIHDAYGRRWRSALGFDQLSAVVRRLIENPDDRQCVIQMWDAHNSMDPRGAARELVGDWRFGENDLLGSWKTRPCNTHCYVRVHEGRLALTVCCRSNDMVWGGHGANAVHFSVLQEYLAARVDAEVGTMYQLSNNAHVYDDMLTRLARRADSEDLVHSLRDDRYTVDNIVPEAMFCEPELADDDIEAFMYWHDNPVDGMPLFSNPWFGTTAARAVLAHGLYRQGKIDEALDLACHISSLDWRIACVEWLERRVK